LLADEAAVWRTDVAPAAGEPVLVDRPCQGMREMLPAGIRRRLAWWFITAGLALWLGGGLASGQFVPPESPAIQPAMIPLVPSGGPPGARPAGGPGQLVAGVVIRGEYTSKEYDILRHIHTRRDREYDTDTVQGDVRRLVTTGMFRDVKTSTQQVPEGVVVIFEVFERPRIREVKFIGNRGLSEKKLGKEIGVKKGDPLSSYAAEESRRKIEELYHQQGYPQATVSILEGAQPGDKDLVFQINEGPLTRVGSVTFEGNTIARDDVLRTKVKSKPGFLWYFFGGKVDQAKLDADVQTLTAYYRSLGYFRARISRALDYDESGNWIALKFIIDEGPRYEVRSIAVVGGTKFAEKPLLDHLALKQGKYFNQAQSSKDVNTLIDLYGSQGHVFADVQADLRFLEEPGQLDVVYRIKEGEVFRVGEVNVQVAGEFPHTKQTVVLNRLSLRPGDLIDTRKVRDSERRLLASQLFAGAPGTDGDPPKIVIRPPDLNSISGLADNSPPRTTVRGQEPDAAPRGAGSPPAGPGTPAWTTPVPHSVLRPGTWFPR
jgi:outer membrane protein insertion porin family